MSDPFGNAGGETRPDAERPDSGFFWKPNDPCYIVGKLDRVEPGKKYGDHAVLVSVVQFTLGHKPMTMAKEKAIGLTAAALEGKLSAADVGKWVRIIFEKWQPTDAGKMRIFKVDVGLDPAAVKPVLKKAADTLAMQQATAPDASPSAPDDDLPF